jgi:hypothetical protein
LIDRYYYASLGLRTIDPHDKGLNQDSLQQAKDWVAEAEVIYILGYGFDSNNNERIGLDKIRNKKGLSIMFTNYNNRNVINKAAGTLLCNNSRAFLDGSTIHGYDYAQFSLYCEKSVRTVYEALDMDFEPLELLSTQ